MIYLIIKRPATGMWGSDFVSNYAYLLIVLLSLKPLPLVSETQVSYLFMALFMVQSVLPDEFQAGVNDKLDEILRWKTEGNFL